MVADFTFRYKNEIKDSALVNLSIKSALIYKTIVSLKITNKTMEIKSNKIELLFNEKINSGFVSRFTTKFSLKEIKELFKNNEWEFIIDNQSQTVKYRSHRKANRAISMLRDKVFILM